MPETRTIIESVLQPPREDSEVPQSRRELFRPGRQRFCPAGGRAPAVPPQPVRESEAARAPAPGPSLPRPSLLGRVLATPRVSGGIREEARPRPIHTSGSAFGEVEGREDFGPAEGFRARPWNIMGSLHAPPPGGSEGVRAGLGLSGACRRAGAPHPCVSTLRCCFGREGNTEN